MLTVIKSRQWAFSYFSMLGKNKLGEVPPRLQHPSARPSPSSSLTLSLNFRATEESDALQLFQLRDSIFYAFLNYLRHEAGTSQAAGRPTRVRSTHLSAFRITLTDWLNVLSRSRLFRFRHWVRPPHYWSRCRLPVVDWRIAAGTPSGLDHSSWVGGVGRGWRRGQTLAPRRPEKAPRGLPERARSTLSTGCRLFLSFSYPRSSLPITENLKTKICNWRWYC